VVIRLPPQPRVLVITLRRLGDVLVTTPLVAALRRGLPGARIEVLVFKGTEGILAGNPDIARVIAMPRKAGPLKMAALMAKLWRRYDLAVSTQSGDRPTVMAALAGRARIGLVPEKGAGWKRALLDASAPADPTTHRVREVLQLARLLGIADTPDVVVPRAAQPLPPRPPYAVLHANPMYRIRRWTDDGWRGLADALRARGLSVVATGGPAPDERAYLDQLWGPLAENLERLDGRLDWGELSQLMARAAVYVGPDTSMTHLAAAAGCPTVAIYGPASPRTMGPWPVGGLRDEWAHAGSIQQRGDVWLVQNPALPCMPCDRLGCDNHLESRSECLDTLSVTSVLRAVDMALGRKPAAATDVAAVTPPGSA
jgi:heptosyltransferase III